MGIQDKKKVLSYFVLAAVLMSVLTPGFFSLADVNDQDVATGSSVSVSTAPPKQTATPKPTDNWNIKLKKVSHPKRISQGSGFDIKGTVISARKIRYVEAQIKDEKGKSVYSKKVKVNKKKFDLKKVDNALKFSKLNKGKYVYDVAVSDQNKNSKGIIDDDFSVKKPTWIVPIENPRWGDGWHCHCGTHRGRHYGWDISGGGLNIKAASSGTVVYAKYHGGSSLGSFGKLIVIYHGNGIYSYYAHCSKLKVKTGQKVTVGDIIGKTGSSGMAFGAHLHFELRKGPEFNGVYNSYKLIDKYTYKQFNPAKKIKR